MSPCTLVYVKLFKYGRKLDTTKSRDQFMGCFDQFSGGMPRMLENMVGILKLQLNHVSFVVSQSAPPTCLYVAPFGFRSKGTIVKGQCQLVIIGTPIRVLVLVVVSISRRLLMIVLGLGLGQDDPYIKMRLKGKGKGLDVLVARHKPKRK